jgi:hypothetical protein
MEERIDSMLKAEEQIKQDTILKKAAASRVNPARVRTLGWKTALLLLVEFCASFLLISC